MRTEIIIVILGMAFVTFLLRFFCIAAFRTVTFSDRAIRWLRYIPIAILTTLIAPPIFMLNGNLNISLTNDYFYAGLASAVIAYKTKNVVATIGTGMTIVLCTRFI